MLFLLILVILPITILGFSRFNKNQEISLLDQLSSDSSFIKKDEAGYLLRFEKPGNRTRLTIALPRPISHSQKLKINYTRTRYLYSLRLEIPGVSDRKNKHLHQTRIIDQESGTITFGLNNTDTRNLYLLLSGNKKRTVPVEIRVSSLTISEKQFIDSNLFFIILMIGVSSSFLLIGIITGSSLQKIFGYNSSASGIFLLMGIFIYSAVLLLILLISQSLFPQHYDIWLLFLSASLTGVLVVYYLKLERDSRQSRFLHSINPPVVLYLFFTVVIAIIVGCIDGIALQEYYWSLIGRFRMFSGHTAHDNVFQYINALAIAENKPFSYFYKAPPMAKKLLYGVEDREVLMGSIIGAYRVLWGILSPYAVNNFGFFVLIGSCLTLLILFPLYAFFARYHEQRIVVIAILMLFLTTYVLGNVYYTWFKILGGACVLSGVYFLHFHKERLESWLLAGFFWGVAINIHEGQAIVYPLLALFSCYQHARDYPSRRLKSLVYTLILTFVVFLMLLPWEVIKYFYFPNNNKLFLLHFMYGEDYAGSLAKTLANFFGRYPLTEQKWFIRQMSTWEKKPCKWT